MKKKLKGLREKRALKKEEKERGKVPRITNENVAEHREEVLSGARKYIYPLQHSKHRIVMLSTTLVIATVLIFTTVSVILFYRQQTTSKFMYQVSKVIPFPVARIGGTLIAYENYLFELRHYIHYYETQQQLSFESESGRDQLEGYKKRALNDVIDLAYTKKLASEMGVTVSASEIDEQIRIAREQNRLGSDDAIFEDVLQSYWDWSVEDFRRSLYSELLTQKVTVALDPDTKARAEEAMSKLDAGTDFSDVVKEYSDEESTKDSGGEFGEVGASNRNVSQQTVDTLLKLDQEAYSDIKVIPYQTGYALEIVKNLEDKNSTARGAHIIFQLNDISEALNDRKEHQPYRVYITLPY